jgi:uncharacterized protein with GYD domain
LIFITLARAKGKPSKETMAETQRLMEKAEKEGAKFLGFYWTLGRYDYVVVTEGPDVKTAMKCLMSFADLVSTETLVAVSSEEAMKLVE